MENNKVKISNKFKAIYMISRLGACQVIKEGKYFKYLFEKTDEGKKANDDFNEARNGKELMVNVADMIQASYKLSKLINNYINENKRD